MASDPDTERNMKCLLCQSFLSDPTTIPCGHNFCVRCIQRFWDMEVHSGIFTCPQCKRTLTRRPSLNRNTALASMVQDFLQLRSKLTRADSMEIQRDIVDLKEKLKKLTKEKEEDLEKLRAAMLSLEESAEAAMLDSEGIFNGLLHTLEEAKKRHGELIGERKKALLSRAEKEEKILIGQISTMKRKDVELDSLVPPVQNNVQVLQKLKDINSVLQPEKQPLVIVNNSHFFPFVKTDLNNLKDHVVDMWDEAFQSIHQKVNDVQLFQAPHVKPRNKPVPEVKKVIRSPEGLGKNMKDQGPAIPTKEPQASPASKPVPALRRSQSSLQTQPNTYLLDRKPPDSSLTRLDLLQHACLLSLNPETAHPFLQLTEDRRVKWVEQRQRRAILSKTFEHWRQVLCVEGLCGGRCYWEVEWKGRGVFIGVALDGLCRKGSGLDCGLGRNASSWCLHCADAKFTAWHNNDEHEIISKTFSPRIGVFLNQLEGTLTFYGISLNALTFLYMFKAQNLRGLLHPGFGVEKESSVKLCLLEKK